MNIKTMTDAELRMLAGEYTKKYQDIFYNKELRKNNSSFKAVLAGQEIEHAAKEADMLCHIVEESIIRQINYLSGIQYFVMEKTGDYTELGEQRVSISYCRFMLNIPPDREVTQYDADRFRQMVIKEREQIRNLSLDQLSQLEKREKFNICGREFDTFQDEELNNNLRYLGSAKRLTIGFFGKQRSIIFGTVEEKQMNGYSIFQQDTEDARTPTNCLSIAAIIGEKNVTIRRVALETIFYNKWLRVFQYGENEKKRMMNNTEGNIREMLKMKALEAYRVKSAADLMAKKDLFISEMIEGVLWHEVGHGISVEEVDMDDAALGEAFYVFEDDMVGVLKEFMADCALERGELRGPLPHFIECALNSDVKKAVRMLLVYLSDNWFLDVNEDFMADQTDIILTVVSRYVHPDMSVDFKQFKNDMPEIFDTIHNQFLTIVHDIKAMLTCATYKIKNIDYNYDEVKDMLLKLLEEDRDEFTPPSDTLQYKTNFWTDMFNYAKNYAPGTYAQICAYIEDSKQKIKIDVLNNLTGCISVHKKSENPLRAFLFERMKELGFYEKHRSLGITGAVKMAIEDCWLPEEQKKEVRERFNTLTENGTEILVSINNFGEHDPFVLVLQEMLTKGQAGKINDGMLIDDTDVSSEAREVLQKNLGKIAAYLDDGSFNRVSNIKVNSIYTDEKLLEEMLHKVKLSIGEPIAAKISRYEITPFDENRIFEVFLPTEWGYWCWNTVQAIWRLNQELRPDEQDKEWVLDKVVLEKISEEYLNSY
ncbi:MAG: hypothetical protein ABIH39_02475 [Candidatus Margulisiibacteriota bacterium]